LPPFIVMSPALLCHSLAATPFVVEHSLQWRDVVDATVILSRSVAAVHGSGGGAGNIPKSPKHFRHFRNYPLATPPQSHRGAATVSWPSRYVRWVRCGHASGV
jgi:hypothetical protein